MPDVSGLEFLCVDAAERSERFRPLARSSLERRLREAGATFEEHDGWLVAIHVPGQERLRLRIRDVTYAFAVAEGEVDIDVGDAVHELVPPRRAGRAFAARFRSPRGSAGRVPEGALDVSAGYSALELEGFAATTLMRRLTDLDLDELPAVGALAHVRTFVFRPAAELYRLFFPQEYGHYLWEVVVDAAEPLGGGPAA